MISHHLDHRTIVKTYKNPKSILPRELYLNREYVSISTTFPERQLTFKASWQLIPKKICTIEQKYGMFCNKVQSLGVGGDGVKPNIDKLGLINWISRVVFHNFKSHSIAPCLMALKGFIILRAT